MVHLVIKPEIGSRIAVSYDVDRLLLTVEELLEGVPAAEEVSEDVERVPEDEVHPRINAAKRITLER